MAKNAAAPAQHLPRSRVRRRPRLAVPYLSAGPHLLRLRVQSFPRVAYCRCCHSVAHCRLHHEKVVSRLSTPACTTARCWHKQPLTVSESKHHDGSMRKSPEVQYVAAHLAKTARYDWTAVCTGSICRKTNCISQLLGLTQYGSRIFPRAVMRLTNALAAFVPNKRSAGYYILKIQP